MRMKRKTRKAARKKSAKRTARKASRRKVAKRATRKKAARKKTARRATRKKAARKKTVRRATRKKAARKKTARRAMRKKAARKKTAKRAARKPALSKPKKTPKPARPKAKHPKPPKPIELIPDRQETGAPTATAGAVGTTKEQALHELLRARAVVSAAIEGLDAAIAEQPLAEGKWNAREVVLHLAARDRARLREMEWVLRGNPASWWAYDDDEQARDNAEAIAATTHMRWEEAVDYLKSTRRELLEALESVPDEPSEVWNQEHTFGRMIYGLPNHDRHHAEAIQRWRDEQGL